MQKLLLVFLFNITLSFPLFTFPRFFLPLGKRKEEKLNRTFSSYRRRLEGQVTRPDQRSETPFD